MKPRSTLKVGQHESRRLVMIALVLVCNNRDTHKQAVNIDMLDELHEHLKIFFHSLQCSFHLKMPDRMNRSPGWDCVTCHRI